MIEVFKLIVNVRPDGRFALECELSKSLCPGRGGYVIGCAHRAVEELINQTNEALLAAGEPGNVSDFVDGVQAGLQTHGQFRELNIDIRRRKVG